MLETNIFTTIGPEHYLVLSAIIFSIGMAGVLLRRNLIVLLMSVELMLNAVNISFVAFSKYTGKIDGQVMVFFVMTIAAAEAAVGLAIVLSIYRNRDTVDMGQFNLLKW